MPNDTLATPRPSLGTIAPNAGAPTPLPTAMAHQSALPWVTMVSMAPVSRLALPDEN